MACILRVAFSALRDMMMWCCYGAFSTCPISYSTKITFILTICKSSARSASRAASRKCGDLTEGSRRGRWCLCSAGVVAVICVVYVFWKVVAFRAVAGGGWYNTFGQAGDGYIYAIACGWTVRWIPIFSLCYSLLSAAILSLLSHVCYLLLLLLLLFCLHCCCYFCYFCYKLLLHKSWSYLLWIWIESDEVQWSTGRSVKKSASLGQRLLLERAHGWLNCRLRDVRQPCCDRVKICNNVATNRQTDRRAALSLMIIDTM